MKKCQVFTPENKFSYIIGNPPYITYSEIKKTEIKKLKTSFNSCSKGKFDYCYAFTYGVQKRTPVRSKEDNRRPKRDSLNYADSMFRMNPEVSRLRIASDRAGSF